MAFRLPLAKSLKMVLAWVLIFAALFVAFALREDFAALGRRVLAEVTGNNVTESSGAEIRIRASADGHFYVDGELNGQQVRFLVDSGATVTTISRATAAAAGIAPGDGFGVMVDTANGTTTMDRGRAGRLRVGPIQRSDLAVHISRGDDELNVIGMNFLSTLRAWSVEGNSLLLRS